jgi:hypothetical protein
LSRYNEEQFRFVGMEAGEQAIEGDEIGAAPENAVETGAQGAKGEVLFDEAGASYAARDAEKLGLT